MVEPVTTGMIAVGAAQAVMSLYQGMSGSRKAKSAGRATARLIELETQIATRRAQRDLSQFMKDSRRAAFASGIQMSGSTSDYIRQMEYRGYEGIQDIRRVGWAQARAARKGGQVTGSGLMTQGLAGALGATAGALADYGAYKQSMRPPPATPPSGLTGAGK